MANCTIEVRFDADGFQAELLRRVALTSGMSEEKIERLALELMGEGSFMSISSKQGEWPEIID